MPTDNSFFGEAVTASVVDAVTRLGGGSRQRQMLPTLLPARATVWAVLIECPSVAASARVDQVLGYDVTGAPSTGERFMAL
eukprot:SAG22_NODE_1042_length_5883_cov_129.108575_4_plen_81_part_00